MNPIDPKALNRISGALAVAESASNTTEGERIAAINAAERMLAKENLRLRDLVIFAVAKPEHQDPDLDDWQEICRCCLRQRQSLTTWELRFVPNLATGECISPRQWETLQKIARRLGVISREA